MTRATRRRPGMRRGPRHGWRTLFRHRMNWGLSGAAPVSRFSDASRPGLRCRRAMLRLGPLAPELLQGSTLGWCGRSDATEPVAQRLRLEGHALPVLRFERPRWIGDVRAVEGVVAACIDGNVAVAPVPRCPQRRSKPHRATEPQRIIAGIIPARRIPIVRRVVVVGPDAINHVRVVDRYIDLVRPRGLDGNVLRTITGLLADAEFFGGL